MAQLNWDDIRSILALVQTGSLTKAGTRLGLNYTTVARRVQRAEQAVGYPLFARHPDGYVPLPEAIDIARTAERMEGEEHKLMRRLAGKAPELSGPLTFTAPQLLIQSHLAPVLAAFTNRYPSIELTVKAGYDVLDLSRREADLAVRISREPQGALVGRRLAEQSSAFFATPEIAEQARSNPEAPVDWLLLTHQPQVPEVVQAVHGSINLRARFDDIGTLASAAEAGMGGVRLPLFIGQSSRGLVRLHHLPAISYAPVWVLSHRDLQNSPKVTALKAMLLQWFRENRTQFVDPPEEAGSQSA